MVFLAAESDVEANRLVLCRLNKLAYLLLGISLILAFIVVASTGFGFVPETIATYAVATAVSLLPASLIAVVSMTLAHASRSLAAKNALVRRMDAIEALSAITDICSDKTGTVSSTAILCCSTLQLTSPACHRSQSGRW